MIEDTCHFKTINKSFPHLANKIKLFWGHPEFISLVDDFLYNSTKEMRSTFPSEVLHAIAELEAGHNQMFPHLARAQIMPWYRTFVELVQLKLRNMFK